MRVHPLHVATAVVGLAALVCAFLLLALPPARAQEADVSCLYVEKLVAEFEGEGAVVEVIIDPGQKTRALEFIEALSKVRFEADFVVYAHNGTNSVLAIGKGITACIVAIGPQSAGDRFKAYVTRTYGEPA